MSRFLAGKRGETLFVREASPQKGASYDHFRESRLFEGPGRGPESGRGQVQGGQTHLRHDREIGLSIEDLEENALALGEEIDVLSDDLADVESVVFDEDEDDGDYFEVECPNCEEPILIDDEALAAGEVQCPNCETRFALDLSDDTVDADEDAE